MNKTEKTEKNVYTEYDNVFLPMLIVTSEQARQILEGNLILRPVVESHVRQEIIDKIPSQYNGVAGMDAIKVGGYINYAGLFARQLSFYPLTFLNSKFLKPNAKYREIGDTAIIVTYPQELFRRVYQVMYNQYADKFETLITQAQYKENNADPNNFSVFVKNESDQWKKEILLTIRFNSTVSVVKPDIFNNMQPINLYLGDISDLVEVSPIDDLIQGNFPRQLYEPKYIEYIKQYIISEQSIKGWVFSVAGNVMSIAPTGDWIKKLANIFPENDWQVCSSVEKLHTDGEALPRLAYFSKNGLDKVYIRINKIDFYFYEYDSEKNNLLKELVEFAAKECNTTFCHMFTETNADLGKVKNENILRYTHFREEKTCQKGNLFESHFLEADYKIMPSILGVEFSRKDWHYCVKLSTPGNEHFMWYNSDEVLNFFNDAVESNLARIEQLSQGDPYERYQEI